MKVLFISLFLILGIISGSSQPKLTENQEKIANSLTEYYKMNRENIYIHSNKSTYLSTEKIWFTGYTIEKKSKAPSIETTNVFVSLLDEQGQKINTQLYFEENGVFQGYIKLNKTQKTGKYYLHAFTNYMNNYTEDESSYFEITIINSEENKYTEDNRKAQEVELFFYPESGVFLEDISNVVGVAALDCNHLGAELKNIDILDSQNNLITSLSTNQHGYGKFEITPKAGELYKAVYSYSDKKREKKLPSTSQKGITFSVINYINPSAITVQLKTNKSTIKDLSNSKFSLVFQQNDVVSFVDFSFKDNQTEQNLTIPSDKISDGINSVLIIDDNLKKIGERIIYKPFEIFNVIDFAPAEKRSDSIIIHATSRIPNGTFSIAVLPEESIADNFRKGSASTLFFDHYLNNSLYQDISYYINEPTRKKLYELDNLLLTQNSKYKWELLMSSPPTKRYSFDRGITIKGTINTELKNAEEYKINMNSIGLGLDEFTSLNQKNEFLFENVIAIDSTRIYFLIIDKKGERSKAKVYSQILNNNNSFTKTINIPFNNCITSSSKTIDQPTFILPKIKSAILLDSVYITARKKKLIYQDRNGNNSARAYKISEKEASSYRDVLQFIGNNGFTVSTIGGEVAINGYSFNKGSSSSYPINKMRRVQYYAGLQIRGPAIYIDGIYIHDYNLLRDYSLVSIDEIYINRDNSDPTINMSKGIIRIYSKKSYGNNSFTTNKSQALVVKNGFQKYCQFENPKYDSVQDTGFMNFGTIDWKPTVTSDQNGNFQFSIPNLNQKKVKIIVEGMTSEGKMISCTKTIAIQ